MICLLMLMGHYADFYTGRNHAYTVGVMFYGKDNAFLDRIPLFYRLVEYQILNLR